MLTTASMFGAQRLDGPLLPTSLSNNELARSHWSCSPGGSRNVPRPQLWATGWQKTGSTIMTMALASALDAGVNTEAVIQCCCKNSLDSHCNAAVPFSQSDCVNNHNIGGSLFNGSVDTFLSTCGASQCQTIKADDMLWETTTLYSHLTSLMGESPRMVFFARHPILNIRALLAWCTEGLWEWVDAEQAERNCQAKFIQIRRDTPNQDQLWQRPFMMAGNQPATNAIDLAGLWKVSSKRHQERCISWVGVGVRWLGWRVAKFMEGC